ncbi:hypothetical protein SNEBB_004106 [Seison nebaliae]|nr:hypothetical protein SNEBB_004106 [Seison nebaliae]
MTNRLIRIEKFDNHLRDYMVVLLIAICSYCVSYLLLRMTKEKKEEKEYYLSNDRISYRISVWICTFAISITIITLSLPIIIVLNNEITQESFTYDICYWFQWCNKNFIKILQNYLAYSSFISLFFLLPFAYLFLESVGITFLHQRPLYPKRPESVRLKIIETILFFSLFILILIGFLYFSSRIFQIILPFFTLTKTFNKIATRIYRGIVKLNLKKFDSTYELIYENQKKKNNEFLFHQLNENRRKILKKENKNFLLLLLLTVLIVAIYFIIIFLVIWKIFKIIHDNNRVLYHPHHHWNLLKDFLYNFLIFPLMVFCVKVIKSKLFLSSTILWTKNHQSSTNNKSINLWNKNFFINYFTQQISSNACLLSEDEQQQFFHELMTIIFSVFFESVICFSFYIIFFYGFYRLQWFEIISPKFTKTTIDQLICNCSLILFISRSLYILLSITGISDATYSDNDIPFQFESIDFEFVYNCLLLICLVWTISEYVMIPIQLFTYAQLNINRRIFHFLYNRFNSSVDFLQKSYEYHLSRENRMDSVVLLKTPINFLQDICSHLHTSCNYVFDRYCQKTSKFIYRAIIKDLVAVGKASTKKCAKQQAAFVLITQLFQENIIKETDEISLELLDASCLAEEDNQVFYEGNNSDEFSKKSLNSVVKLHDLCQRSALPMPQYHFDNLTISFELDSSSNGMIDFEKLIEDKKAKILTINDMAISPDVTMTNPSDSSNQQRLTTANLFRCSLQLISEGIELESYGKSKKIAKRKVAYKLLKMIDHVEKNEDKSNNEKKDEKNSTEKTKHSLNNVTSVNRWVQQLESCPLLQQLLQMKLVCDSIGIDESLRTYRQVKDKVINNFVEKFLEEKKISLYYYPSSNDPANIALFAQLDTIPPMVFDACDTNIENCYQLIKRRMLHHIQMLLLPKWTTITQWDIKNTITDLLKTVVTNSQGKIDENNIHKLLSNYQSVQDKTTTMVKYKWKRHSNKPFYSVSHRHHKKRKF